MELHTAHGIQPIEVDCSDDLYHINVRAFLAAIREEGRPTATGTEGLGALQVALAVEESLRSGQAVVLDDMN